MNDQQNRSRSYGSNRYPAFLIVKGEVPLRDRIGIVENEYGSFKTNIMLAEVLPVLVLVPCKSHSKSRQRQDISGTLAMSIRLYVHVVNNESAFIAQTP